MFTGTLPTMADFLLAYSTIPGLVSWRDPSAGSLFISALVDVFNNNAHDEDVLSMLIKVNAKVGDKVAETESGDYKQQPQPSFTLRKKLHFYPPKK